MIIRIVIFFCLLFQSVCVRSSNTISLKNDTIFSTTNKKPVLRIQKKDSLIRYFDMTSKNEPELYKKDYIFQRDSLEELIRKELYKKFEDECPVMTITYIVIWKKNNKLKDVYLIQSYDGINNSSLIRIIKKIIKKETKKRLFKENNSYTFFVGRVRLI